MIFVDMADHKIKVMLYGNPLVIGVDIAYLFHVLCYYPYLVPYEINRFNLNRYFGERQWDATKMYC